MTPLAGRLRELIDAGGRQSVDHLRRALLRKGQNVPADFLVRELRGNPALFRPTGDGGWDLAEHVAAPAESVLWREELRVDPLVAGALADNYVVVDLETTGTDAQRDGIVQIAAVRVVGGRPVKGFNRYTRTKDGQLAESLRVRMGWERIDDRERVDLRQALNELQDFVAQQSIVAWTAGFVQRFFKRVGVVFDHLIDALALAMLVVPDGPHGLAEVAGRRGLSATELPPRARYYGPRPSAFPRPRCTVRLLPDGPYAHRNHQRIAPWSRIRSG